MKAKEALISFFPVAALLGLDLVVLQTGAPLLGCLVLFSSFVLLGIALLWSLQKKQNPFRLSRSYLGIPAGVFLYCAWWTLETSRVTVPLQTEPLEEIGNLLTYRYLGFSWLISVFIFATFLLAGNLFSRRQL